jgi:hypothetical protein
MPILYYKADVRKYSHDRTGITTPLGDPPTAPNPDNIYDYRDNQQLVELGQPWEPAPNPPTPPYPPLASAPDTWFYEKTTNPAVTGTPTPYKKDSYIMISAGWDGIYGTTDDIFSFDRR